TTWPTPRPPATAGSGSNCPRARPCPRAGTGWARASTRPRCSAWPTGWCSRARSTAAASWGGSGSCPRSPAGSTAWSRIRPPGWRTPDGRLSALDEEAGQRLQSTVADAHRLASEIADLNRAIHQGGDRVAPDLLDARELRISQLAALTGATTVEQDGMLNVFTSGGQPLVVGSQAMQLATTPDPMQPGRMQLSLQTPGGDVRLPSATVSGELG